METRYLPEDRRGALTFLLICSRRLYPRPSSTPPGFSLIETLIIVALMGIIGAIASPSLAEWLQTYRLKGAAQELVSTMQLARIKAISQKANCVLSFSTASDGGYTVFMDDGSSGANNWQQDTGEETVKSVALRNAYPGIQITSALFSGNSTCAFNSIGSSVGSRSGSVTLRNGRGEIRQVILSSGGAIGLN